MFCLLPAAEKGYEMAEIKLELQLVVDFGLMDVPNAGKSILLNALTLMNECFPQDGELLVDIPGLIEVKRGTQLGTIINSLLTYVEVYLE